MPSAVQLSSLKTEMERVQCQKEKLQLELQTCRTELQGLRVALSHLQGDSKTLTHDKVLYRETRDRVVCASVCPCYTFCVLIFPTLGTLTCYYSSLSFISLLPSPFSLPFDLSPSQASLQQQCLELRSQIISMRSQVDTSQTVQRDFVQLSQSLQVHYTDSGPAHSGCIHIGLVYVILQH